MMHVSSVHYTPFTETQAHTRLHTQSHRHVHGACLCSSSSIALNTAKHFRDRNCTLRVLQLKLKKTLNIMHGLRLNQWFPNFLTYDSLLSHEPSHNPTFFFRSFGRVYSPN